MMKEKLEEIREKAAGQIGQVQDLEGLNQIRVTILGKKGELTGVLKSMRDVAPQDRPAVGKMVNETRAQIEAALEEARKKLAARALDAKMKAETIDVTLPARSGKRGHSHPNTLALDEVKRIFVGMGYEFPPGRCDT